MKTLTTYSTETIGPGDRFSYWREAVCDSYVRLGCDTPHARHFSGELSIRQFASMAVSRVSGSTHSVVRRQRDIRADSEASFILSIQRQRTSRIAQFGHTAVLKPGDMAIYDSTQPYQLDLSNGFSQTVLQFSKEPLLERLPQAQLLGGIRIDGQSGIGQIVSNSVLELSEQLNEGSSLVNALLQESLLDLIATGLATNLKCRAELSSPEQQILMRARAYIGAHLNDPGLNREQVARSVNLSIRRLNDVFAKQNTSITREIRGKRLAATAAELADARYAGLSISEIALARGFSNLQHFSTLFKKSFERSPKEYRSEHMSRD